MSFFLWRGFRLFLLGCAFSIFPVSARAQVQDVNAHAWFMYFGDHPISAKWGVHLEGQARRTNFGGQWQQLLLRPGVNYQLTQHWMGTLGYAYARSSPYGEFPVIAPFNEHRIYQQLWGKYTWWKIPVQHRLRLEQRYVENAGALGTWQYRNRFRYMLRGDIPFGKSPWYIGLYDEVFLNFGKNRGPRALDQNRAYGVVGYKPTRFEKVEVGYLHQYIPQRSGIAIEHNHTLQIALFSNRPFQKK